jgi:hypothetical protein
MTGPPSADPLAQPGAAEDASSATAEGISPAAVETLIAAGHSLGEVWGYRPRQTQAFLLLASQRRRREPGEMLAMHALAASGDGQERRSGNS